MDYFVNLIKSLLGRSHMFSLTVYYDLLYHKLREDRKIISLICFFSSGIHLLYVELNWTVVGFHTWFSSKKANNCSGIKLLLIIIIIIIRLWSVDCFSFDIGFPYVIRIFLIVISSILNNKIPIVISVNSAKYYTRDTYNVIEHNTRNSKIIRLSTIFKRR